MNGQVADIKSTAVDRQLGGLATILSLLGAKSFEHEEYVARFQRDGFLYLPGFYSDVEIAEVLAATETLLAAGDCPVTVDSLESNQRHYWRHIRDVADNLSYKFNDLYLFEPAIRELAMGKRLSSILKALMGDKAVLCNSLSFAVGSQQPPHVDSLYMTPQTPNKLLATWIALEDVHSDAGPMSYYPGSHLIPRYIFADGSRHVIDSEMPDWHAYMDSQVKVRGLEQKTFLAKKGDVFIWHSELLHGGSAIDNPALTRRSLVSHYYCERDCRRLRSDLQAMHDGYWMRRAPAGVPCQPGDFTESSFPEANYLARYGDVAKAVRAGRVKSGYQHWLNDGCAEGRLV
ncbi:phytanoyl-CoA dioxygenase family protein [Chitinimonas sp.]|uniref:phytanoyl-CoA dioxygenase family protein n=1 Tax=Chitinimonas sp. TaxID=1934313 RepID=UPI0035B00D0E